MADHAIWMSAILNNVLFTLQTAWPTNVSNPHGYEALDWEQRGTMPFVPSVGMHIDCGDGNLREVRHVYWSAQEPNQIEVNFVDDVDIHCPVEYWIKQGWQSSDLQACDSGGLSDG